MRKGKEFEELTKRSLKKYGFVYRFRDTAVNPVGAYRIPVPSDFLLVYQGIAYFFECKSYTDRIYLKSAIRESQIKYAKEIIMHGGKYYFLFKKKDSGYVYALNIYDLDKLINYRKTVGENIIKKYATYELPVIVHINFDKIFKHQTMLS